MAKCSRRDRETTTRARRGRPRAGWGRGAVRAGTGGDPAGAATTPLRAAAHGESHGSAFSWRHGPRTPGTGAAGPSVTQPPRVRHTVKFFAARSPPVSMPQFSRREDSTDFFTGLSKLSESPWKPPLIHSQFTLNPQLVHEVASGLHTLPIAAFLAGPPKSSGGFSCPRTPAWIQESPAAAATPTSPVLMR